MNTENKLNLVIFHREWWMPDGKGGRIPGASTPKVIKEIYGTYDDARKECEAWNNTHPAGRYDDRAEFQRKETFDAAWR